QERVHGAHAPWRAQDTQVDAFLLRNSGFQIRFPFQYSKPIRKRLCRVFPRTVSRVDQWDAQVSHDFLKGVGLSMPRYYPIAVGVEHSADVRQGLPFRHSATLSFRHAQDLPVEPHYGTFERESR